jgi:hypothetical protein
MEVDNVEKDDNKDAPAPVQVVPVDVVKDLVAQVTKLADRPVPVAPAPAPVSTVDPDKVRQEKAARWKAAKDKANELASAGDVAGAIEHVYGTILEEGSRGPAPDPTSDPGYRALVENTRRLVRAENTEVFDRYKAEIEAEVAKLDPSKRLLADSWEEAIGTVRSRHFQEELEAEKEKLRQEYERDDAVLPPVAGGNRGRRTANPGDGLDEIQRNVARSLGLSHEQYAAAVKETGPSFERGEYVPLIKGELLNSDGVKIERGKF